MGHPVRVGTAEGGGVLTENAVWQLAESDDDSDFSSPERRYFYDTHGRLRVEERWINSTHTLIDATFSVYTPDCATCGCDVQQLTAIELLLYAAGATAAPGSVTHNVTGVKDTGSGSASAISSLAMNGLPGGGGIGNGVVAPTPQTANAPA